METILPEGNCKKCGRYFKIEWSAGYEPQWFTDAIDYGKESKYFNNAAKWFDSGLCANCYIDKSKKGK